MRSSNSNTVVRGQIRYSGSPAGATPVVLSDVRPPRHSAVAPPAPRLAPSNFKLDKSDLPRTVPAAPAAPNFKSFAEYLRTLVKVAAGEAVDNRLQRAPTGLNEADPTAGGWLVPAEFSEQLIISLYSEATIAPLCTRQETAFPGRELLIPGIDETSRADGSRWGGVLSYWLAEGPSVTTKFPRFRQIAFNTSKIIAIGYGVNQLLEDAPAFAGHCTGRSAAN